MASVHAIMSRLAAFDPVGQTGIGSILHEMAGQIRRKGIVILISDLFDDERAIQDGLQHLRFGGHEVIVFHVMDPFELEFPFGGMVEFDGLEREGIVKTGAGGGAEIVSARGRGIPSADRRHLRETSVALCAGQYGESAA